MAKEMNDLNLVDILSTQEQECKKNGFLEESTFQVAIEALRTHLQVSI